MPGTFQSIAASDIHCPGPFNNTKRQTLDDRSLSALGSLGRRASGRFQFCGSSDVRCPGGFRVRKSPASGCPRRFKCEKSQSSDVLMIFGIVSPRTSNVRANSDIRKPRTSGVRSVWFAESPGHPMSEVSCQSQLARKRRKKHTKMSGA